MAWLPSLAARHPTAEGDNNMAMSIRELQQRRAAKQPEHAATKQGEAQTAAQIARLNYEQQCQGRELSERDLLVILQRNMHQWQQQGVPSEWQVEYIRAWNSAALSEEPKREATRSARDIAARVGSFGAFLKFLRERADLKQWEVADQMPENHRITLACYGAIERGTRLYPHFEDLAVLYKALVSTGVEISSEERAAYILLAQCCIQTKSRQRERITPTQWEALSIGLAAFDDSTPLLISLVPPRPAPAIAAPVPAPKPLQRQKPEPAPAAATHQQAAATPAEELLAPAVQPPAPLQQHQEPAPQPAAPAEQQQ